MNKIATVFLTALMVSATVPVFSQTPSAPLTAEDKAMSMKTMQSCMDMANALQQKMKMMHADMKKNPGMYSMDDLRMIEQSMKDIDERMTAARANKRQS